MIKNIMNLHIDIHIFKDIFMKIVRKFHLQYTIGTSMYKLTPCSRISSPLNGYKLTTLYWQHYTALKAITPKNFTCLISIIRSHLNWYICSQVPVNANIYFTSTALLHSDKCDRYACLMSSSWLWSASDELPERWTLVYL